MLKHLAALCAAAAALFVFNAAPAYAGVGDFLGNWTNAAPADGVTRVVVSRTGGALRVRVFGRCHPSDCDWGAVNAAAFAPTPAGNVEADATTMMATFTQSFARKTVILRRSGANLDYEILTEFTDSSGRPNYLERGRLARAGGGGGGGAAMAAEDCVGFTPGALRVVNIGGRWKIVEGTHYVADFAGDRAAAEHGLAIILRYGFTMQCFVARPNAQMTYWRRGAGVPSLPTGAGEDCISINPANVRAQHVGGAWKVVDGGNWLLDYGANRANAEQAAAVIQHYNMNRQCFVARPNPPMMYWLSR